MPEAIWSLSDGALQISDRTTLHFPKVRHAFGGQIPNLAFSTRIACTQHTRKVYGPFAPERQCKEDYPGNQTTFRKQSVECLEGVMLILPELYSPQAPEKRRKFRTYFCVKSKIFIAQTTCSVSPLYKPHLSSWYRITQSNTMEFLLKYMKEGIMEN